MVLLRFSSIRKVQSICLRSSSTASKASINIQSLLSTPTWSVSSLLPLPSTSTCASITREKLHHLLRLSALELPATPEEEQKMLRDLSDQLHFVRAVQAADTTGVEPLSALRDETLEAEQIEEQKVMEECEEALANELVVGKYYRRIRAQKRRDDDDDGSSSEAPEGWKAVDAVAKKHGQFFLVEK